MREGSPEAFPTKRPCELEMVNLDKEVVNLLHVCSRIALALVEQVDVASVYDGQAHNPRKGTFLVVVVVVTRQMPIVC